MAHDILLNNDKNYLDISFDNNGDFAMTEGFEMALLMSVYCEKKANSSEVPAIQYRRGWWGNKVSNYDNYEIGSKLWLLNQSRRDLNALNLAKTYLADGLQWFVDDAHIDKLNVNSSFIIDGIEVDIILYRSQNVILSKSYQIWENTNIYSIAT